MPKEEPRDPGQNPRYGVSRGHGRGGLKARGDAMARRGGGGSPSSSSRSRSTLSTTDDTDHIAAVGPGCTRGGLAQRYAPRGRKLDSVQSVIRPASRGTGYVVQPFAQSWANTGKSPITISEYLSECVLSGLSVPSPSLPVSLIGCPVRKVTAWDLVHGRLPPGIAFTPNGAMILTDSPGIKTRDVPEIAKELGLQFIEFRRGITVDDVKYERKASFSASEAKELREQFQILRMTFPVRCGQPACATLTGPCRELWQTNILVVGVLLRRMECDGCGIQYLVSLTSDLSNFQ